MAVALSDIPKIAFAQNEIAVTLTSDDYLEAQGRAAVYSLSWIGDVLDTDFIQLQFDSRTIVIEARDNPDDSGNQVISQGELDRVAYGKILVEALKGNHAFSSTYTAEEAEDGAVRIRARKPGIAFGILSTGSNFFLNQEITPLNRSVKKNFQHFISIVRGNDQLFESLLPLNYPVNGKTSIDISGILFADLGLDIPDLATAWQVCEKSVLKYKVRYANAWGDPAAVRQIKETDTKLALIGGFSKMALAHIQSPDHLEKYLLADPQLYQSQNWFESYPVDNVEVKTNQPQFLYFINSRDQAETFKLKVSAFFQDETVQEREVYGGLLASLQKVCVPVGYLQLGLDAISTPENHVVAYTVQLVSAGDNTPRTVAKRFAVNRCYEANTRYFLYSGSDGNFKTLRTYGTAEANAEFETETGVLNTTQSNRIKFGDMLTFDVVSYENEVVSSGYIVSRHSHEAVKEFMLSTRAFRVIGNKLIPIEITSKEMPLPTELQKNGFVQIEYRLAWEDRFYTGDTSALSVPIISQSQQSLNDI